MSIAGRLVSMSLGVVFVGLSSPTWAGVYDEAMELAKEYIDSYEDIRKIDVDERQRLIKALCEADDDERQRVTEDEASRVFGMAKDQKERLDKLREEATQKITAAVDDGETTDNQKEELEKSQKRMSEIAPRIEKLVDYGAKMGSNPVVNTMRKLGQLAHDQFYAQISACASFRDIRIGALKPDCILPSECMVIELKSYNDSSISKGWTNAQESRDLLNEKGSDFQSLVDKQQSFSNCAGIFKARVDCYHYCPEVKEDGTFEESAPINIDTCKT